VLVAALLITFGVGAAVLSPTFARGAGPEAGQKAGPGTAAPITGPTGARPLAPTATPTADTPAAKAGMGSAPRPTTSPTRRPRRPATADNLPASGVPATEDRVTVLVNRERARAGCGAVRTNAQLRRAARGHSLDMAEHDYFSHTSLDGRSPWDRARAAGYEQAIGENIAKGQPSPESVMDAWMNSPGHRNNILNCDAKAIGVGLAYDGGTPVWTQLFGSV